MKVKNIENCARCGMFHSELDFERLVNPIYLEDFIEGIIDRDTYTEVYTHWCPCPYNGQPILMLMYETGPEESITNNNNEC